MSKINVMDPESTNVNESWRERMKTLFRGMREQGLEFIDAMAKAIEHEEAVKAESIKGANTIKKAKEQASIGQPKLQLIEPTLVHQETTTEL